MVTKDLATTWVHVRMLILFGTQFNSAEAVFHSPIHSVKTIEKHIEFTEKYVLK